MLFDCKAKYLGFKTAQGKKDSSKSYTFVSFLDNTSVYECLYTGNAPIKDLKYLSDVNMQLELTQNKGFYNLIIKDIKDKF